MLADEVLKQYENVDSNNYAHIVDNFILKVKNLAKTQRLVITSNMDVLKYGITDFVEYNTDISALIKKIKKELNRELEITKKTHQQEGLNHFKKLYMETCIAFIKTLKRLRGENGTKANWQDLVTLLGTLEVSEE